VRTVRVTDANVVVAAIVVDTDESQSLRERLHDTALIAPHVIDLEATNSLRRLVQRGRITSDDAVHALRLLKGFSIDLRAHAPLLARCWELRDNVTPHDASYVALAEALGVPILTADARLANAPGIRCEVELLT
jgi:predicted nucleic acid-binding protein